MISKGIKGIVISFVLINVIGIQKNTKKPGNVLFVESFIWLFYQRKEIFVLVVASLNIKKTVLMLHVKCVARLFINGNRRFIQAVTFIVQGNVQQMQFGNQGGIKLLCLECNKI